jgi:hypothetical protein
MNPSSNPSPKAPEAKAPRTKGRAPEEDYTILPPPQIDDEGNPVIGDEMPGKDREPVSQKVESQPTPG